jgi:hypothetical protein
MRANSAATKKPFRSTRNKITKSLRVISGHDRLGSTAAVAKNIGMSIDTGGKKLLKGVWEFHTHLLSDITHSFGYQLNK